MSPQCANGAWACGRKAVPVHAQRPPIRHDSLCVSALMKQYRHGMMPGYETFASWVRQRTDCPEGRKIIAADTDRGSKNVHAKCNVVRVNCPGLGAESQKSEKGKTRGQGKWLGEGA